jgi:hypothetical protein
LANKVCSANKKLTPGLSFKKLHFWSFYVYGGYLVGKVTIKRKQNFET